MSENVIKIRPQRRISSINFAPFDLYQPLSLTVTVGEFFDKDKFELMIIFASVVRFESSSLLAEEILHGFELFIKGLNGFYVSKSSLFLKEFKDACDDGFKQDALDSMWHYRIFGDCTTLNIISQRNPRLLKITNDELITVNPAEDLNNAH